MGIKFTKMKRDRLSESQVISSPFSGLPIMPPLYNKRMKEPDFKEREQRGSAPAALSKLLRPLLQLTSMGLGAGKGSLKLHPLSGGSCCLPSEPTRLEDKWRPEKSFIQGCVDPKGPL